MRPCLGAIDKYGSICKDAAPYIYTLYESCKTCQN